MAARKSKPDKRHLATEQRLGADVAAFDAAAGPFRSPVAVNDVAEIAGLPRRRAHLVARTLVESEAYRAGPGRGYLKAA